MHGWDVETGCYQPPSTLWKIFETDTPEDAPDIWLSRPRGTHYIGMSFHFAPYNFPKGTGTIDGRYDFSPAPFLLQASQDDYNSWGVSACLKSHSRVGNYWDWLPGILIVDTSIKYSLPHTDLAAFAGTKWSDSDSRVFSGFYDAETYSLLVSKFLELVNRITGPRWANWPFGERQLANAVVTWLKPESELPDVLLLASVRQHGVKYVYFNRNLYSPKDELGAWEQKPLGWDCRQALRFLYQAKLMLNDGLSEMALSTAIASLENVIAEVLLYLLKGDKHRVGIEVEKCNFLSRFDKLLPKYGARLPKTLFDALRHAYFARNGVIHGLRPVSFDKAAVHIHDIETIMVWYWENVGDGASKTRIEDDVPF